MLKRGLLIIFWSLHFFIDFFRKIGRVKAPTLKTPNTIIDDVDEVRLNELLDEHEHVAVLFYSSLDKETNKILAEMQQMETEDLDLEIVR